MKLCCPECENACSDEASSCPKCGHLLQRMTSSRRTPIQLLADAARVECSRVAVRPVQAVQETEQTTKQTNKQTAEQTTEQSTEQTEVRWKRYILPAMSACLLGIATCSAGVYSPEDEPSAMSVMGAVLALAGFLGAVVAKVGDWRR